MLIESFCPILASIPTTERQVLWQIIQDTFPYNILGVLCIVLWVLWEIKHRNGTYFYRSKNGYTPLLNTFVGSASYFGIQFLLPLVLSIVFGNTVYCSLFILAASVHVGVYFLVRYILHDLTGFWPEKRASKRLRRRF